VIQIIGCAAAIGGARVSWIVSRLGGCSVRVAGARDAAFFAAETVCDEERVGLRANPEFATKPRMFGDRRG